jgi:hypothetical protein
MTDIQDLRCLNKNDECQGPVELRYDGRPDMKSFPRCDFHWAKRLEQREGSMEQYAYSDVPPPGWHPEDAGEVWGPDDY